MRVSMRAWVREVALWVHERMRVRQLSASAGLLGWLLLLLL